MTSGYSVPCARYFISPKPDASSSKILMKSLPIIFLFFSGSVTPFRAERNFSSAFTYFRFIWSLPSKISRTSSTSFFLSTPLFTNTQIRLFPIALFMRVATTEESTPPLNAQSTLLFPTSSLILSTASSTNDLGEKSPFTLHIL